MAQSFPKMSQINSLTTAQKKILTIEE